jgi:hypothetical protein
MGFGGRDVKKMDCLDDLRADGRLILVWMIRDVMDWIGCDSSGF